MPIKKELDNSAKSKMMETQVVLSAPCTRIHRHTLMEMNYAVFTARCKVAHDRVLDILQRELFANPKEQRIKLYKRTLRMLKDAIMSIQRSQTQQDSPLIHYLQLLKETISANLALVKHEVTLVQEAGTFSEILGEDMVAQFQSTSDVFSNSEMNILDCIDDLLRFGKPIVEQAFTKRVAKFSPDSRRRYYLALAEYKAYYEQEHPNWEQ